MDEGTRIGGDNDDTDDEDVPAALARPTKVSCAGMMLGLRVCVGLDSSEDESGFCLGDCNAVRDGSDEDDDERALGASSHG